MNTPLKKQSIHLFIDINIPESTVLDINQTSIQEAIRRLFQNNLQALAGDSPEEILQKLGFSSPRNELKNKSATKGKWARIIEQIEQNAMGEEAGKEFDKGRKEFRETFAIGDA
jgi:hypothetical protein